VQEGHLRFQEIVMHDRNGKLIEKGDKVALIGTLVETYPGSETCNIVVEQTDVANAPVRHTLCARNVEKVEG
jgi:uncharacterized Zn ribbon protein